MIAASTIAASTTPPLTSATSVAAAPASTAPTIGKNAARKVRTIKGSAIGTPTATSTIPISTASSEATRKTPCT